MSVLLANGWVPDDPPHRKAAIAGSACCQDSCNVDSASWDHTDSGGQADEAHGRGVRLLTKPHGWMPPIVETDSPKLS